MSMSNRCSLNQANRFQTGAQKKVCEPCLVRETLNQTETHID